jgi:RNA polymerase sigma-70 factor (ECF subfamily)
VQDTLKTEPCADDLAAERDLIRRAQQDRAAFGALYDRCVEEVYRYAYHVTNDHLTAQDVTAETFRRALEGLARYTWQGKPFRAWLVRIARYVWYEKQRALRQEPLSTEITASNEPPSDDPAALEVLVTREESAALWQMVGELAPDYQRILIWRYAREWDYAAIAAQMGRTPAACKQQAYRALCALRQRVIASGLWSERGQHEDK